MTLKLPVSKKKDSVPTHVALLIILKIYYKVDVEVLNQHPSENDAYITRLRLSHLRIIRLKNGGHIKHAVDKNLEKNLSKPFFFVQNVRGKITTVFFPHDDSPELVGLKKGKDRSRKKILQANNLNTNYVIIPL